MNRQEIASGVVIGGLPPAPAWDFPGAAAIRAERMRAHMAMAAALRQLSEEEELASKEREREFRQSGGYRRPEKRRMTAEQLILFAKLQEAARTLPPPTGRPGTAFPRLDLIGDLICECERANISRAWVATTVRSGITSLREWLRSNGFGRLPPGRRTGGKNLNKKK